MTADERNASGGFGLRHDRVPAEHTGSLVPRLPKKPQRFEPPGSVLRRAIDRGHDVFRPKMTWAGSWPDE
jgi:hypothetical protein